MAKPLLSLIIPTRERAQTLVHTLATALDQRSQEFEVVVSDNASEDDTRQVVDGAGDPRVRYFNTGRRLSMCDNYEFALENARGDYAVIIGDDDAVLPGRLDALLERLGSLPEPLTHMWPLHVYDWPIDGQPAVATHVAPQLAEREIDLKDAGRRILGLGGWKYGMLPSPYHGAVPTRILNALRARTGRVFHSTQPDVFTAMAIPAFADRAINLGRTVTMNGRSPKSNGRDFLKVQSRANLDRFIGEYGDYRFHPSLLPDVPATANMIPDAVLMAKDMFPEVYGGTDFDYSAMWAYVCRLGFVSTRDVLSRASELKRRQHFSLARFARFSALHQIGATRREILNRTTRPAGFRHGAPANIHDFVRQLSTADA